MKIENNKNNKLKKSSLLLYLTLLFCILYFIIIPTEYSSMSFLVLFAASGCIFKDGLKLRYEKNKYLFLFLFFLAFYLINLFFISNYTQKDSILRWFALIYCIVFIPIVANCTKKDNTESVIWFIALVGVLCTIIWGTRTTSGDLSLMGALPDKNYSAIIIFLLFMYSQKRKQPLGFVLLMVTIIFLTSSRGLVLLFASFLTVRYTKKYLYKIINHKYFISIFFIVGTIAILLFSYFWVDVVSNISWGESGTRLNDMSNRMRFSANIYAWENQLSKINYHILFCGYGDGLKTSMGIPHDECVIFNGVRLVVSHNATLNTLLILGWVPGLIYIFILGYILQKYCTYENVEYVFPILIDATIIPLFKPGILIMWFLILILPQQP